jgi:hypothetical protein
LAIVQISRITNRKGSQVDLPQLAGAELGWSIDSRRLFIGNGTLEEGAPIIGNTEILTEFSDILAFQTYYTYKGQAAGYTVQTGPTAGTPISQSLQSWLDQFATVKDFGATGDGLTDDTEAINRALYQLYCRDVNPQIRRSLFFPAGRYRITSTILIPPYATLYGEGKDNSIIVMDAGDDSTLTEYVARTADSLQQIGPNIGSNGAIIPQYVTISNMGFKNNDQTTSVFLVEDAINIRFQSVEFTGALTTATITTDAPDTSAIRFSSTPTLICDQIVFDDCRFGGCTYGVNTASAIGGADQEVTGLVISNSKFAILHKGVVIGSETASTNAPTGVRIVNNIFNSIYAEGVIIGSPTSIVELNATGHNIFYDVGNYLQGTASPETVIIDIYSDNNVSIGDMFARDDTAAESFERIRLNGTTSLGITNSKQISIGTYTRESGMRETIPDNVSTLTTLFTVDSDKIRAFSMNYTIVRGTDFRTGTMMVAAQPEDSSGELCWSDDYVENLTTGVSLSASQVGNVISVQYTTESGEGVTITHSINHLA